MTFDIGRKARALSRGHRIVGNLVVPAQPNSRFGRRKGVFLRASC